MMNRVEGGAEHYRQAPPEGNPNKKQASLTRFAGFTRLIF
jgi:hypothetical protein